MNQLVALADGRTLRPPICGSGHRKIYRRLDTTSQGFFTPRWMMAAHIETGTMASPQHYSTRVLHHLGLVATMQGNRAM